MLESVTSSGIPDFHGKPGICPLLPAGQAFVTFAGNGVRKGQGYLLQSAGGWLAKTGYDLSATGAFLSDFADLGSKLGLTLIGVRQRDGRQGNQWVTLAELRRLANLSRGRPFDGIHIRIYAPINCFEQWADYFQPPPAPSVGQIEWSVREIQDAMQLRGVSQKRFAELLQISAAQLNRFLRGKRRMPVAVSQRARALLTGANRRRRR